MNLRSLAISASLLAAASIAWGQPEDFYEARLVAGYEAMRAKRVPEAIDQLRIAAFGLMDRPPLLSEALVRLALAQEAIGPKQGAAETIKRFVDVERRFGAFTKARLEPTARTAFRNLFAKHVPAATIASLPSFGGPPPTSGPARAASKPAGEPAGEARGPRRTVPETKASRPTAREANGPARYLTRVAPEYPPDALKEGVGGIVLLRVLVSEAGAPLKVDVIRKVRPDLAEAAVSAVKRWTFEPARKDGLPVQASLTVPILFDASQQPPPPR
jgi:TonB family protein